MGSKATWATVIVGGVLLVGLAMVVYPNFKRFKAKSIAAEAKANLSALHTGLRAFYMEWNTYHGDFRDIGFGPVGELRFRYSLGGPGPKLPKAYTFKGGSNCRVGTPGDCEVLYNSKLYCAKTSGCFENKNVRSVTLAVEPTKDSFTAAAAGFNRTIGKIQEWTTSSDRTTKEIEREDK